MESPNQYMPKFIPTASTNAKIIPPVPPSRRPAKMKNTVIPVSNISVLKLFTVGYLLVGIPGSGMDGRQDAVHRKRREGTNYSER
jgi:hypothetical protein